MRAYITKYTFENESIRFNIKVDIKQKLEYRSGRYVMLLKDTTCDKEVRLNPISVDLSSGEFKLEFKLNTLKYFEKFTEEEVEVYLVDSELKSVSNVEVITDSYCRKQYYNINEKKFLEIYKSEEGSLLIKRSTGGSSITITERTVNEKGVLYIKGVLNFNKLHSIGYGELKKFIVKNDEKILLKSDVQIINSDNEYVNVECKTYEFETRIDLLDTAIKNKTTSGKIYLLFDEYEEELRFVLNDSLKKIDRKQLIYIDGKITWMLDIKCNNALSYELKDISSDLEVEDIKVEGTSITFKINKDINGLDIVNKECVELLLKNKTNKEVHIIKCLLLQSDDMQIKADIENIVVNKYIKLDTYEAYLKINDKEYRIACRKKKILKREDYEVGKIYLLDDNERDLAISVYYDRTSCISLVTKRMMEVTRITDIVASRTGVVIQARMFIRKDLGSDNKEFTGIMYLELDYGVKVSLNYFAKINKERPDGRYDVEISITKDEIELNKYNVKYIAKNLSNRIVYCSITSTPEKRYICLNIKPKHIRLRLGDRIENTKIGSIIEKTYKPIYKILNTMIPIKKNLIVFQSLNGQSYSCDPKVIYEQLLKDQGKYKYVWVLNEYYKDLPGVPKVVKPNTIGYYYYMARAKYFISNTNMPTFYKKREDVVNVNIFNDYISDSIGKEEFNESFDRADKIIVQNEIIKSKLDDISERKDDILGIGCPRNDIFYNDSIKRIYEIKNKLSIPKDKKVLLYEPALRRIGDGYDSYNIPFDINAFNQNFGHEYMLLVKLSEVDMQKLEPINFSDSVKNVSLYEDISELYLIADILISDYSKTSLDYVHTKKPILLYAYDLEKYETRLNELFYGYKEVPFPVIKTEEELFNSIKEIGVVCKQYESKYRMFYKMYRSKSYGQSSKNVIESILKDC